MYGGSRKDTARNENDFYPTPPFAVSALLNAEDLPRLIGFDPEIWEPACGKGYMADEMRRHGYRVRSTDKYQYPHTVDETYDYACLDFLETNSAHFAGINAVITNPPYSKNQAELFARKSIAHGKYTAMLCRTMFAESARRLKFFREHPPSRIYQFSGRFSCQEADLMTDPLGGMVAYAWFVWSPSIPGPTELKWLDSKEEFSKWKTSYSESNKWSVDASKMYITGEEEWSKDPNLIAIK